MARDRGRGRGSGDQDRGKGKAVVQPKAKKPRVPVVDTGDPLSDVAVRRALRDEGPPPEASSGGPRLSEGTPLRRSTRVRFSTQQTPTRGAGSSRTAGQEQPQAEDTDTSSSSSSSNTEGEEDELEEQDARVDSGGFFGDTPLPKDEVSSKRRHALAGKAMLREAAAPTTHQRDFLKVNTKTLQSLRQVAESVWAPIRSKDMMAGSIYWTILQRQIGGALLRAESKKGSKLYTTHKYVVPARLSLAAGREMESRMTYMPGLRTLPAAPMRYRTDIVRDFYATLWVADDRSAIWFMFEGQPVRLTQDDIHRVLGAEASDRILHNLAYEGARPPRRPSGGVVLTDDAMRVAFPPPNEQGHSRLPHRLTHEARARRVCYSESGLVDIDSIRLPLYGPKQVPEVRLRPRSDEFVLHHLTPVAVATMSAFAWACISEGLNPEPHAFYQVYQARHTPTYDHENHLSPCFGVVGFEAREGFLTPLGSFDPPPFDEWVKDWFYYKYFAIDFYTGKAAGIWITNDFEPPQNSFISRWVDAFRRVSQRMTLRDILEECFAAGVLPLARRGFNLWSPQDRVTSFLGKFSQKEWVESTRRGISVRINRFYLSFDLCLHNRSSTVEMDPLLAVVTPDVESIPKNSEIPSPPGSLLMPTYSLIFEEPSADDPSNSAVPPVAPDTACGSSSLIPSEVLRRSPTIASDVVCMDGIAERSELVDSCQLPREGSNGTFGLPRKSSFLGLLGKRKLPEVSDPSQDTALPSIDVAVPPSQSSNPDASSLGSLELDVEAMLSAINDDVQASGPFESAARKVRFPKVELGLSNLSGDVLFRSLVAHQVKSIILTRACACELQDSSGDLLLASSLQASLSAKDDSLKASSAAMSNLLAEVEASQLKIASVDNSSAKSLALCDLVKEMFQALGAKYDEVPADVSLKVLNEWLRLNLVGLAEICRSFSCDAVVLMIRDLLHSFSCEGSDAVNLVSHSDFSMKPSDPSHDFGAVEGKCIGLINDLWWNRVSLLCFMEALWDRLPRGIVKDLTRHGYKRGDALPQDLVDHFDELDRLSVRNAIVEVPPQPVPLVVVPPDVIIISDDEGSEGHQVRPSPPVGVASRTRTFDLIILEKYQALPEVTVEYVLLPPSDPRCIQRADVSEGSSSQGKGTGMQSGAIEERDFSLESPLHHGAEPDFTPAPPPPVTAPLAAAATATDPALQA
ncbi:hypothetical protein EJB05_30323, partial [Eragrostis curvula]